MYKIISKVFRHKGNRFAMLECSCGKVTQGQVIGSEAKGTLAPKRKQCATCFRRQLRKHNLTKVERIKLRIANDYELAYEAKNNGLVDTPCHTSTSRAKDAMGYVRIVPKRGQVFYLHEMTWLLANDYDVAAWVPKGKIVDHKCNNPACCNIEHLELIDRPTSIHKIAAKYRLAWQSRYDEDKWQYPLLPSAYPPPRSPKERAKIYYCNTTWKEWVRLAGLLAYPKIALAGFKGEFEYREEILRYYNEDQDEEFCYYEDDITG